MAEKLLKGYCKGYFWSITFWQGKLRTKASGTSTEGVEFSAGFEVVSVGTKAPGFLRWQNWHYCFSQERVNQLPVEWRKPCQMPWASQLSGRKEEQGVDLWGEGAGGASCWGRSSVPGGAFWWAQQVLQRSCICRGAAGARDPAPAPSSVSGCGVWGMQWLRRRWRSLGCRVLSQHHAVGSARGWGSDYKQTE